MIAKGLQADVRAGRAAPADLDQAAEVIARLAMSLLLTREGTITLDDDATIVALVRHTLLPMLRPDGEWPRRTRHCLTLRAF